MYVISEVNLIDYFDALVKKWIEVPGMNSESGHQRFVGPHHQAPLVTGLNRSAQPLQNTVTAVHGRPVHGGPFGGLVLGHGRVAGRLVSVRPAAASAEGVLREAVVELRVSAG